MDITVIKGFPVSSVVKNTPARAGDSGDAGWIPGSGRSPGGGNSNTLQYSCSVKGEIPWTEEPDGLQSIASQSQT